MRAGLAHEETLPILARGLSLARRFGSRVMRRVAAEAWRGWQLYNTDDGMTVTGNLIGSGPAVLRVEGCVGGLCGGES